MRKLKEQCSLDTSTPENTGQNNERRYTGGILTSITNVIDDELFSTPGQLTEGSTDTLLIDTIFAFEVQPKGCIQNFGPKVAGHLQRFGKARWQPTMIDGAYGVNITSYNTTAGQLLVHLHPQFRQIPTMDKVW